MPTADTAAWVRVRLATPKSDDSTAPTEGELVLRADRVAVEDDALVFLCAEEVVFRLERRYFRALTWFVDRPTFGEWLKGRRAQFPNANRPWVAEEIERLVKETQLYGMDWQRIAESHGRTVSAVKRQAALLARRTEAAP